MPLLRHPATMTPSPDPRLSPESVVRSLRPVLSESRRSRLEQVLRRRLLTVTVVLENLYDPHNGAAVLRTCEALGLLEVHVVEGSEPFFFSRKVSQSAHKWLNVHLYSSIDECVTHLQGCGFTCWAAVPPPLHGSPPRDHPLEERGQVALVFGNEHAGLSARALELCERRFSIPLQGFTESLNLSVSVAVALSRVTEERRRALAGRSELDGPALERLRAGYYALSTPHAVDVILGGLARRRVSE